MITLSKIKGVVIEKAKRILKVEQYGIKTADEVAPFGDDASPLKNMTAIYANTQESGTRVILGYINKQQLAAQGEKRIFSLKADGTLSFDIHLKNDGTCEIGGKNDNLVKYIPLDAALKAQDTKINEELLKISTALTSVGGTYVPGTISTDITNAKTDNIKTA